MTGTQADVIRIGKAEKGYHEGRSGGHWNNDQKYSDGVPGLEWSDWQAWCATFVSWLFQTAGLPKGSYPVTASCSAATSWWKSKGRFSEYPAVGAQVMYGAGGGAHTGVVYAYDGTYIYTVEGNTNDSGSAEGDGVYLKKRARRDSYVYGYGYPSYPGGIVSADPAWGGTKTATTPAAYEPFPGASWFTTGRKSPVVAAMHARLVAVGCNHYTSSTNKDVIGTGDVASYEAFQRSIGLKGADAKWPPGPTSWAALKVPNV